MRIALTFNAGCVEKLRERVALLPHALALEVLSSIEPYVPVKTGYLRSSGQARESGIAWDAPYAQFAYERALPSQEDLRGPYWFDRWKADEGADAIRRAIQSTGGNP